VTNKEIATSFLQMASSGNVRPAYEKYVASNFIHHNQYFKGDRRSLMEAMESASKSHPNKSFETKFIYEDGNKVITHSLVKRAVADQPDVAVVHIFRFEGDKIAELWDLGQPLDPNSPNENGPF
jgi:predicted SnoaL-like aldol condensation-catalyzing enzyme